MQAVRFTWPRGLFWATIPIRIMKRYMRFAAVCLAILVTAFLCLRKDWIDPLPGVSLEPARALLREADIPKDGAFDLLLRAGEALGGRLLMTNQTIRGKGLLGLDLILAALWESPPGLEAADAVKDLEDATEVLRLARLASAAGEGQVPTADFAAELPYLAQTRALVARLNASAARKAASGDAAGALDDLLAGIRLAQILSRGGTLIQHLVDIGCTDVCLRTLRLLALRDQLPAEVLRSATARLDGLEHSLEPLPEVLRQERLPALAVVDTTYAAGGPLTRSPLLLLCLGSTPARTKCNFDALYAHLIQMSERPYDPAAETALVARITSNGKFDLLMKRDPVGRMLALLLMPSMEKAQASHIRCIASLRATRVVLAICCFKVERSRVPSGPAELVPDFLPEWPLDSFDGKPLRWRTDPDGGWAIYSIGENLVDEGGTAGTLPNRGDLVFSSRELAEFLENAKALKNP